MSSNITKIKLLDQQDRYRIDGLLGRGGGGEVYSAFDIQLHREVAIKVIDYRGINTFIEAQALARLDSSLIVRVFDVFHDENSVAIVMEIIKNSQTVSSASIEKMTESSFLNFYEQILSAVETIHSAKLLHLDLKPSNILVNENGNVKLTDFGISISVNDRNDENHSRNKNETKGSWFSITPEHFNFKKLSEGTDVFALGILLFNYLYKAHPFIVHGDAAATKKNIINAQIQYPEKNTNKNELLISTVTRMLDKKVSKRPTVEEVLKIIRHARALIDMPTETIVLPKRKRILKPGILLFVLAVIVSSTMFLFVQKSNPVLTALVVPPTKIEADNNPVNLKQQDYNLLVATIIEDEIEAAVISDPGRSLVSKKEWGGTRDWSLEAQQVDVDEIILSDVDCDQTFCEINVSIFSRNKSRITQTFNKRIPHSDLMVLSNVILQSLSTNMDFENKRGVVQDISNSDLLNYYKYRVKLENKELDSSDLSNIELFSEEHSDFVGAQLLRGYTYLAFYSKTKNKDWLKKNKNFTRKLKVNYPGNITILQLDFKNQLASKNLIEATKILNQLKGHAGIDINHLILSELMLIFKQSPEEGYRKLLQLKQPRITKSYYKHRAYMEHKLLYFEALEETAKSWLKKFPNAYWAEFYMASSSLSSGKLEQALNLYQSYYARNTDVSYLENIGICHLLLGNYDASIQSFRKMLEITPDSPYAMLNLAEALKAYRSEESDKYFAASLVAFQFINQPTTLDFAYQAMIYAHIKKKKKALIALQQAALSKHKDKSFYLIAAYVYSLTQNTEAAVFNARKAMQNGYRLHWFNLPWTQSLYQQLAKKKN